MKAAPSPAQAVIRLVLKWWWLIAISVALGVGVGYLIRAQQPPIYYAKATVLFGQNITRGLTPNSSFSEVNNLIGIYSGLIRRPVMLEPVIRDLNLGITVDQLNEMMTINTSSRIPLLEIEIADERPDRAATIANRIAQEMITQSPTEQVSQETRFKREQLRGLEQQIRELQTQYDQKIVQGSTLTSAFEITQNLQERKSLLENIQQLQQIYAEMSAGLAGEAGALQIFEPAVPATAPEVSGMAISVVLSGVAGLVLSVATIVFLAYFDDRLQWHDGMERIGEVRVLGPLGVVPRSKLPLYVETIPDSIESEMVRQLRAKMVLAAGDVQPRVVTITSYDSGDGKTVTAANLGLQIAKSGLRTLLIDGDIRKGDLNEVFRLPNVMGLSDILAGREDLHVLLSRTLLDSGYENLTVLTAGRSTADPAALLSGPRFIPLINVLKAQFDVIILDSVPTIGGPDAAFLAEASDGVVIVVDSRRTTEGGLKRTLEALHQARGLNIFGVVFNRVRLQMTSTAYHPYYRRTLTVSPERLQRELLAANSRRLNLKRNVLTNKQGERLYSLAASALQLGITQATLQNWIDVGYLKPVRQGLRRWIRESELQALLERLPRYRYVIPSEFHTPERMSEIGGSRDTASMPQLLRGQRDALLDYVREPVRTDDEATVE